MRRAGDVDLSDMNQEAKKKFQLIGLGEKMQENPIFHGKTYGFPIDFPLSQPIEKLG